MNRSFPAFSQKKNLFIQNYFGTFSPRCSGVNQAFVLWTFLAISRMPISFCSPSGRNDQSQMKLHNETRRLLADRTKLRANIITISEFPWKDCTHVVHRRSKWIVASRLDSSSLSSFLVDCFFHSPKQKFEKNNNKFTHTHVPVSHESLRLWLYSFYSSRLPHHSAPLPSSSRTKGSN